MVTRPVTFPGPARHTARSATTVRRIGPPGVTRGVTSMGTNTAGNTGNGTIIITIIEALRGEAVPAAGPRAAFPVPAFCCTMEIHNRYSGG